MTTRSTLEAFPNSFFVTLLGGIFGTITDEKGYIFIDRSPSYFEPLLDYMRTRVWRCPADLDMDLFEQEASFYGILPAELSKGNHPERIGAVLTKTWSQKNEKNKEEKMLEKDQSEKKYLEENTQVKVFAKALLSTLQDMIHNRSVAQEYRVYFFPDITEQRKQQVISGLKEKDGTDVAFEIIYDTQIAALVAKSNPERHWEKLATAFQNVYDLRITFSRTVVNGTLVTWRPTAKTDVNSM
eukprot:Phypoly_transcript_17209.p1 GENE.Phypoly_transcript_17209~~Phypoly_transcript_17209.p1  ORF type:complete len:263 (+),score=38.95 Phypoly_transcript_17209:68-790(+)